MNSFISLTPPGPRWQALNAALHREPWSTIVHAVYWSLVLTVAGPVSIVVLVGQAVYNLTMPWISAHPRAYYHTQQQKQKQQLAVVITGCDSGFGKELAIWAAQAGYTVFAGCLSSQSFTNFDDTCIRPMVMDVTREDQVQNAVHIVQQWMNEEAAKPKEQRRVLHALCNNAGIGVLAPVDIMELADMEKMMQGKEVHVQGHGTNNSDSVILTLLPFYFTIHHHSQLFWYGTMLQGIFATFETSIHSWYTPGGTDSECCQYGGQSGGVWIGDGVQCFETCGGSLFTWIAG